MAGLIGRLIAGSCPPDLEVERRCVAGGPLEVSSRLLTLDNHRQYVFSALAQKQWLRAK
jgi:hypothetical protein